MLVVLRWEYSGKITPIPVPGHQQPWFQAFHKEGLQLAPLFPDQKFKHNFYPRLPSASIVVVPSVWPSVRLAVLNTVTTLIL